MVPLLSLGIPFSPATAILLGALVIHGLQPGPLMISQRPEVFWGFVASMYIGTLILLILNVPFVGLFVSVLRLPQHVLATLVLLLCLVGAFSLSNSHLDLWILVVFGVFGYALRKLRVDASPLVVALVLGPMMEKTLRQSLFIAQGSVGIFLPPAGRWRSWRSRSWPCGPADLRRGRRPRTAALPRRVAPSFASTRRVGRPQIRRRRENAAHDDGDHILTINEAFCLRRPSSGARWAAGSRCLRLPSPAPRWRPVAPTPVHKEASMPSAAR